MKSQLFYLWDFDMSCKFQWYQFRIYFLLCILSQKLNNILKYIIICSIMGKWATTLK